MGYSDESHNVLEFHVQPGRVEINISNDWWSSCVRGEWEVDRGQLGKARPDGPRTGPFFHAKWFSHAPHDDSYGKIDGGRTSIAFWFILLVYLTIWLPIFLAWRILRGRLGQRARERAMAEAKPG